MLKGIFRDAIPGAERRTSPQLKQRYAAWERLALPSRGSHAGAGAACAVDLLIKAPGDGRGPMLTEGGQQ
jgi:hypothetical protein